MKHVKKSLILSAILLSGLLSGQSGFTIKMKFVTQGLPEQYAAAGEMEMVMYSKGDKYKSETSSMMFNNTSYFDGITLISLNEFMGNKTAYKTTKEELEPTLDPNESKPSIEYTNEKKMIAGYECSKAIISKIMKDKSESKSIVWYTDKIRMNNELVRKANKRSSIDLGDLKGVPLAFESKGKMFGMDVTTIMTVTEILTTDIPDSVFVPNTEGYEVDSYKVYMDKMKAMQQGGGR